jgi:hypothetical protein
LKSALRIRNDPDSTLEVGHVKTIKISLEASSVHMVTVWRIRDVYPGSRIPFFTHSGSRISDPKTATKERGEKNFVVITFYVAINFTKLQIILVLKC